MSGGKISSELENPISKKQSELVILNIKLQNFHILLNDFIKLVIRIIL